MSAPVLAVPRFEIGHTPVNKAYNPGPFVAPGTSPEKFRGMLRLPVSIPLSGATAHGGVFGGSGSGKSTFYRVAAANILTQAEHLGILEKLQTYFYDGK